MWAEPRGDSRAGKLAREVSALQAALLGKLHAELAGDGSAPFAAAAQKLAEEFGSVTATAIGTLWEQESAGVEAKPDNGAYPDLHQAGQMRERLDRLVENPQALRAPLQPGRVRRRWAGDAER